MAPTHSPWCSHTPVTWVSWGYPWHWYMQELHIHHHPSNVSITKCPNLKSQVHPNGRNDMASMAIQGAAIDIPLRTVHSRMPIVEVAKMISRERWYFDLVHLGRRHSSSASMMWMERLMPLQIIHGMSSRGIQQWKLDYRWWGQWCWSWCHLPHQSRAMWGQVLLDFGFRWWYRYRCSSIQRWSTQMIAIIVWRALFRFSIWSIWEKGRNVRTRIAFPWFVLSSLSLSKREQLLTYGKGGYVVKLATKCTLNVPEQVPSGPGIIWFLRSRERERLLLSLLACTLLLGVQELDLLY